jgi:O-antigen/teichoic acid export membrane protein
MIVSNSSTANRQLWLNATAGAAQALFCGIILFLIFRILINRLDMDQIGTWALLMAWLSLGRIADLGMPGAIIRIGAVLNASNRIREAYHVIWIGSMLTGLLTAACTMIIGVVIYYVFFNIIVQEHEPIALIILAILTSWLSHFLVPIRSALDAINRVDLRHLSTVVQNSLLLVTVYFLVDAGNLLTLFTAQLLANVGCLIFVLVLHFIIREKLYKENDFKEGEKESFTKTIRILLSYGVPFQLSTVAGLLLDPLVKLLLSSYSSLAIVAYYELSSRIINQARAVLVSPSEALVPFAAKLSVEGNQEEMAKTYSRASQINMIISTLGFSLLIACLPIIGLLWFGHHKYEFMLCGAILGYTTWVSIMAVPAYFFSQGLGDQRWNVWAHITILGVVLILGVILGYLSSMIGILIGYTFAITIGNFLVLYGLNKRLMSKSGSRQAIRIPSVAAIFPVIAILPIIYSLQCPESHIVSVLLSLFVSLVIISVHIRQPELLDVYKEIKCKLMGIRKVDLNADKQ